MARSAKIGCPSLHNTVEEDNFISWQNNGLTYTCPSIPPKKKKTVISATSYSPSRFPMTN